jgi:uncharacterized protein involved in type VI secretion and phage assembly
MQFSFRTECDSSFIARLLSKRGIGGYAPRFDGELYRLVFDDDTYIRELTLWAAAAFSCGLIERPEIERM